MPNKRLDDLFHDVLKDVYYAETKILESLPKMADAAQSEELRKAFLKHRDETEGQVQRLRQVFEMIGQPPKGKTCEAIRGMIEEDEEVIRDYNDSDVIDAGLIADGQAVEHYEMARYGTLKAWAKQLGMDEAASLLNQTLDEEKKTDALLTELAEADANRKAA